MCVCVCEREREREISEKRDQIGGPLADVAIHKVGVFPRLAARTQTNTNDKPNAAVAACLHAKSGTESTLIALFTLQTDAQRASLHALSTGGFFCIRAPNDSLKQSLKKALKLFFAPSGD